MFKTQFNSLYVAVMDFVLNEKNTTKFDDPAAEINHYKSVVDEYYAILFNLEKIVSQLITPSTLRTEINDAIVMLNATLEKYKSKSASVRAYLHEIQNTKTKTVFADTLYRFEQSLVSTPLVKVDVEEIQNILASARTYTKNATTFYYFTNNPYELDSQLNIIVPTKFTFDTADKLIAGVYNYAYALYNRYIEQNKVELTNMTSMGLMIENKIYEYVDAFNLAKKNALHSTFETTPEEYYDSVEELKVMFDVHHSAIVNAGVYRFTALSTMFETSANNVKRFIAEYELHNLYVVYKKELEFGRLIEKLHEYIKLIEDGKIKIDIQYIVTNTTLKTVVDDIIDLSKVVKKRIAYTQKYHESGNPTHLEFEFYQSELFLESVKKYYYSLMSENIYRYSNLGIDDFGDATIDEIRNTYKSRLAKYNQFISKDTTYLNNFEYDDYYVKVVKTQSLLKTSAAIFFDGATKTSPVTYISVMEKEYTKFLKKLDRDLVDIRAQRITAILEILDPTKIDAYTKLTSFAEHVTKVEHVLKVSKKYVFLGLTEYINQVIYNQSKIFLNELKTYYNTENYVKLLEVYNKFYSENIIDFNLLYALEKFSDSVEIIFEKIDIIDDIYVDEYTKDRAITDNVETLDFLNDMFGDETYKVTRSEMFSDIDMLYEFIISTRPNEKTFLINEKNLKKLYFDNQLMKINYIRWYHDILLVLDEYKRLDKTTLSTSDFYNQNKNYVEKFNHKDKINTMILVQNQALSEITKMIVDYSADTNFNSVNLSSDIIRNIEIYNVGTVSDFNKFKDVVEKMGNSEKIIRLNNIRTKLTTEHTAQWVNIISNNNIIEPEKVSYNEMEVIRGAVPYSVELEAKMEADLDATGNEIVATYKWFIESVIKVGNKVAHTFYESGKHSVRCEITYPGGESLSRYLEFELTGPQNALTVKSDFLQYSPLKVYPEQTKITYRDEETGTLVTIPLIINGNILDMVSAGSIDVSESDNPLLADKNGLIILGYDGMEFAGDPYDYTKMYEDDFKYPEEGEFIFDFKVSEPLSGNFTVDIADSKFTTFMTKLPKDVESVYQVKKASIYTNGLTTIKISAGDRLIFKNRYDRYGIVEVKNIRTFTEVEKDAEDKFSKYYYEIGFNYYVNISINQFDRDEFKPTQTNMVVPTIVFKTEVRELFNSLVARLEEINKLREQLNSGTLDNETYETISTNIKAMEDENRAFYLFEELDKIKAKYYSLNVLYKRFEEQFDIDYTLPCDELDVVVSEYESHINETKTFYQYMNDVKAYNFKQNIVDLGILIKLYKDQQTVLEILIGTYEYKKHNMQYYVEKIKNIKMFDTTGFVNTKVSYKNMLVTLVNKLRNLFFKIKLAINYPIMTTGQYVVMTSNYYRLKENLSTHKWAEDVEPDMFLLNKKLELRYGYEIKKTESGLPYKDFISDIVSIEKDLFGKGLSSADVKAISNYIQVIESKTVGEYDDFFLIPFWIDYLEKNV